MSAQLRFARFALFVLAVAFAGCDDDSAEARSGLDSLFRVAGGQFAPGAFPADVENDAAAAPPATLDDGGVVTPPTVTSIDSQNNSIKRGTVGKGLRIVVTPNTRTVAIGLAGEQGYWLVPVALRSVEFDPNLELTATLEFDRTMPLGPTKLWFAGLDAGGQVGPARALDVTILEDLPVAPLVVSLTWSANVDLDLVVVHPDGSVLTNKAIRSPTTGAIIGKIDLDSNANCIIDGHRSENASYTAASSGEYKVFVREAASCGVPLSGWRVRVLREGNEIQSASGSAYAYETDVPNGGPDGPGRFALSFSIGS